MRVRVRVFAHQPKESEAVCARRPRIGTAEVLVWEPASRLSGDRDTAVHLQGRGLGVRKEKQVQGTLTVRGISSVGLKM